jgi:hypothetical protein
MKKHALAIVFTAGTLLLTGCGSSAPTAKDGVATADQMSSIDKIARAVAAEKYSEAVSAGYYKIDIWLGTITQDADFVAENRKSHKGEWDDVKADFEKGCTLVADKVSSSGVITSNVVCKGEDEPKNAVSVQYLGDKVAYVVAEKN